MVQSPKVSKKLVSTLFIPQPAIVVEGEQLAIFSFKSQAFFGSS